LQLKGQVWQPAVTATDVAPRSRRLLALYLAANMLLERNQIWSWKELEEEL
jgi:hypothetical protein